MLSPNFVLSNSNLPGSKQFYALIQKIGIRKHIPKGKLLIRRHSQAISLYYIEKGAFKKTVKAAHKDYILAFTFDDDINCCPIALMNNLPNNFDVEAITDSVVLICDFEDFKKSAGTEQYLNIISNMLVHYSVFLETQIIESLSLTAEQRYHRLLTQQPDKIKQIPLTLIASYLGISLERLSRIRKKMKI